MTDDDGIASLTRGFTSYTRADNEAFRGVVDQLRADLTAMYEATTGKKLVLFLDRDSIGWGEDWRQRIHESVEAASVFIPIVTMRYFNSAMCMEELLTFHAAAERLGVTELILPIVLFGSGQIVSDDPRSEVRLIARLNYKNVEAAWMAGYDSSEWRSFIADCVRDLDSAIQRAETRLAEDEVASVARIERAGASADDPAPIGPETESDVSFDLEDMTQRMEQIEPLTQDALAELEKMGRIFEQFDFEGVSTQTAKVRMMKIASDLREPANAIRGKGEKLEKLMFGLDSDLRALVAELSDINHPQAREQLADMLDAFQGEDLSEVETEIQSAIEMIRLVSLTNVSLKRSLQPASNGFRSIRNAVGVFRGWQKLRDDLGAN